MMYTLKGRYALTVLLLFTRSHSEVFGQQMQQQQQRYNPAVPPLPWYLAPPWEYIVREIILKSVTPSPADANAPHRRSLDASFYGGPVAVYSNDDVNVVLSRGNVYHLANGHWILCQDGCVDCEPCVAQRNPSFKWVLQRVKRLPASDPPRHDLQLTIMPQADGHFHASNLWPNSYVYVTSTGERAAPPVVRTHQDNDPNSLASLEDSFSRQHHRSKNPWRLPERDTVAAEDKFLQQADRTNVQENVSTEKTAQEESPGQKHGFKNIRRLRSRPKPAEKLVMSTRTDPGFVDITVNDEETSPLAPKLILGIDRRGRKHLVHVVPLDPSSINAHPVISFVPHRPTQFVAGQAAHSNKTIPERDGQTYQRIFRRVFDSLNTHRRSIENFLESPADNVNGRGISPSGDNTEVAGFFRNNRDADRTSVDLETTKPLEDAFSSSFYAAGDTRMRMHRGYERRRDDEDTKRVSNNYYSEYRGANLAKVLHSQAPVDLDRGRERRRIHVKPHSVDGTRQNTPRINLSISSQSSDDSSAVVSPKAASGNGLVTNSAKQIDLNDTSVGRVSAPANNDSIESTSITTNRKNEQLFTSESLKSGNANRDFQVLRHPFRIIVTTESLVIRREHETPNRNDTLQITTSKTPADSS